MEQFSPPADVAMRLRVVRDSGLAVQGELLNEAIAAIESALDASARRRQRDSLIRRAWLIASETPSRYAAAGKLASEAKAMMRSGRRNERWAPQSMRAYLSEAARLAPLPASHRQFYRVLLND